MQLLNLAVLLRVGICYGGEIEISKCTDQGSGTVTMTGVNATNYPPLDPGKERFLTYKFEVSKTTSPALQLSSTADMTFQCPNGTMYKKTEVCSTEIPYQCVNLTDGVCRKEVEHFGILGWLLSIILVSKETIPCDENFFPGKYVVEIKRGPIIYECKLINAKYTVQFIDGSVVVGCFFANL